MKQRMIALTLTLTLLMAAAVSAFAVEPAAGEADPAVQPTEETVQEEAAVETETAETEPAEAPLVIAPAPAQPETPVQPAPVGRTVQLHEIRKLVEENNLQYRSLQSTISYMDEVENVMDAMDDSIAKLQAGIAALDPTEDGYAETRAYMESQLAELQQARSGMSAMKQDTTQMKSGCSQLIYGAESYFIALVGMERQEAALERQLAALDRTLEELRVRAKWGQVSQLQLTEAESGRGSLVSGLATLRMNITSYKMRLEQMIGEETNGTIVLGDLPVVTAEELNSINPEKDLEQVRYRSYEMRAAAASEDSAFDMADSMPGMSDAMDYMLDAAHFTYKEAEQQVELKFQLVCLQLQDQKQALAAAEAALAVEQQSYQAQELKYQRGMISKNELLTAEDELKTAQEAVQTAKDNLFSAYNNYRWAVDHGVLN